VEPVFRALGNFALLAAQEKDTDQSRRFAGGRRVADHARINLGTSMASEFAQLAEFSASVRPMSRISTSNISRLRGVNASSPASPNPPEAAT
jgi:hypothetical protein